MSVRSFDDLGERLICEAEVRHKIGFGHKWIWQSCKTGRFPGPVPALKPANRWRLSEVDRWIAAQG